MNSSKEISSSELILILRESKKKLIKEKKILDKNDKHKYPIADIPFEIPNTWEWVYLSDVSIIQEGPGIRKHQYSDEGIQFLTVTNILEGSVDLDKSKKYMGLNEYYQKYQHFTINQGDIVTACSGATWGKSAIYEDEDVLMLNTSTLRLRFFEDNSENRYLYYLTKADFFKNNLKIHSTGQQPNYGYSHYSRIPIPLPPLQEQQQIVTILDEAFAAIDQAKANIEKNIANAKELFQSKLNAIFSQKGEGWEEKKLSEVCIIQPPKKEASEKLSDDSQVSFVPMPNLGIDEMFFNSDESKTLKEVKGSYTYFREGDVVLAKITPCFENGKLGIARDLINGVGFGSSEYIVYRTKENITPEYLYFFLNRQSFRQLGQKVMTGSVGHKRIPKDFYEQTSISLPSLESQQQIVSNLINFQQQSNKLEDLLKHKLKSLDEIKKSILQKAFSGELTSKISY